MAKTEKMKTFRWQAHKPLLATVLAVAGIFNMANAVLALGTAAGTNISNTATATYNDGQLDGNGDPVNVFDATSNTVTIKVAEIAGLFAVARPVEDVDGGAIESGDTLTFIFDVSNRGNAATDVFVPGKNQLDDFTTNFDIDTVTVYAADGITLIGTTGIVPDNGDTLTNINGSPIAIPADQGFVVKVTGTPSATAIAGSSVSVRLGNTDDNIDEGPDETQNQKDVGTTGDTTSNASDLRTVDPTAAITTDNPENGEREAQATGSGIFASSVRPLALATVLKTGSNTNTGVPADPTDDIITYNLGLRVENSSPSSLFQPAALEGTNINLSTGGGPSTVVKRVLVSDFIPANTDLVSVSTSLPAGWTAVYTTDSGSNSLALQWTTVPPTNLSLVTRVGFIFNGTIGATGTTLTGLSFNVVSNGLPVAGGAIDNIAQVFGQTVGDPAPIPQVIYDESGDSNPNNFDGTTLPDQTGDQSGSDYNPGPGVDDGIPNKVADGIDTAGNNTGSGEDGEVNVISIIPTTDDILNGTAGTPNAIGPTGDNDDFTNKAITPTPTGPNPIAPTASFDPTAVVFNNTLSNPASVGFIAETTVEPRSPSQAALDSGMPAGTYGSNLAIPDLTEVTMSNGTQTALYRYDQGAGTFNFISGTRVNFGDVIAGQQRNYTVTVDLPNGTEQLIPGGVSIPIIAFPDDDPTGTPGYTGETTNNITIDRLYTGFMSLLKEARVLDAAGVLKGPDFSINPTTNAAPGEFIEYRITYENISQALTGPGSITLTANDFIILEDGNAGGNTWASVTTHQAGATASDGSIRYFTTSGSAAPAATSPTNPASGTPIEKYENEVTSVVPQDTGTFQFRRVVN